MKRFLLLLLLAVATLPPSIALIKPQKRQTTSPTPTATTRYERFIERIFENADSNHDGSISAEEVYDLVLRLYIYVNRQAPIDPPSRAAVHQLFQISDKNRNHRISRDEFTLLARLLGNRAFARIVTCKLITLLVAPFLATFLVQSLSDQAWLPDLAAAIFPSKVLPVVTSVEFWRTVWIVVLVATLGKSVMHLVNAWLDLSLTKL